MEENIIYDSKSGRKLGGSLSATVIDRIPFRFSGNRTTSSDFRLNIPVAEEQLFKPGNDYVFDSVKQRTVMKVLVASRYSKPLYMIVGLKIAAARTFSTEMNKGN